MVLNVIGTSGMIFVLVEVFVLLAPPSGAKPVLQNGCSFEEIGIENKNGTIMCVACPVCPPGQGSSVDCETKSSKAPKCIPCIEGMTYNDGNTSYACMPCTPCGEDQHTTKQCTAKHNTVCGECKNGTYREPSFLGCQPCSKCCGEPDPRFIAEQCKQDGWPPEQQCRNSDSRCRGVDKIKPSPSHSGSHHGSEMASSISYMTLTSSIVAESMQNINDEQGTEVNQADMHHIPTSPLYEGIKQTRQANMSHAMLDSNETTTDDKNKYKTCKNKYLIVMTNPLSYILIGFCSILAMFIGKRVGTWRARKCVGNAGGYTVASSSDEIDNTKESIEMNNLNSDRPSSRVSSCYENPTVQDSHMDTLATASEPRMSGISPSLDDDNTVTDSLLATECYGGRDVVSTSTESIFQAIKDCSIQEIEANIDRYVYLKQLLLTKVENLPHKYRKDIGLKLAIRHPFGYDGCLFLEKIGLPSVERDQIWGAPGSSGNLWQVIINEFKRKTDGTVATLRKKLLETDRKDIVHEGIYPWLEEKICEKFPEGSSERAAGNAQERVRSRECAAESAQQESIKGEGMTADNRHNTI